MLKSRVLRLLMWAVLALALLIGVSWLAVPPLLKWQLQTRGSELLGRDLRVDEVRFVPLTLALTLRGLSVGAAADSEDRTPQLHIDRLFVDLDARSLLRLAPVIGALQIDAPRLRLGRLAEGRSDVDDLLQRFSRPPADPAAKPARFALFNLRLNDGEVVVDDRVVGRKHDVRKITLGLPFLSNLPADVRITVEPRLAFEFNGSAFESHGRSTPFAEGRASELQLQFDRLDLSPLWAYVPTTLPARPSGGRLSSDLTLRFEQPDGGDPRVQLTGQAALDELSLRLAGGAPLLAWHSLRVKLADVHPLQHHVVLDSVQIDGAQLHLRRSADGRLELQQLAGGGASAAPSPAAPASAAASNWQVQVGLVELKDTQVRWSDAAVQPAAELQLDGVALQLKTLHWPADVDATLRFDAVLSAQGQAAGQLHAEGTFTDRQAKLAFKAGAVDLALAAGPYVQQYLQPQASARIAADGGLEWARGSGDHGDGAKLALLLSSLQVDDFSLAEPATPRTKSRPAALAQWARLELSEMRADLLQQRVVIGKLGLHKPQADLARDRNGALNAQQWLKEADTPATRTVEGGPPWLLELREFLLDDGRLRFADAALPGGPLELSGLRVAVQGLAWPLAAGAAPLESQLSATLAVAPSAGAREGVAKPARLDWRGRVGLQPLAAKGQLRAERLPVHAFEPYFGEQLPVRLQRLEAGFQGQLDLRQATPQPALRLQGDALLADLRVLGRDAGAQPAPGSELLSWNALNLDGLDLELQPGAKPRVTIRELRLADFFSRLEITEDARFNLQTVAAGPTPAAAKPKPVAPAPAAPAASAADGSVLSRLPVELLIEGMQFSNGRIDFQDRFVRPNYRADLSDLNGRIGRLDSRSRDMATLQFSGRVAGTGQLEIGGALNPTVIPPALDLQAKAQDIELPGLTPYSSKYAGYPIERGKLSMNVAYKVASDGKLEANNQIIVNQLTFGPKTDSPDATKLPVPLVVALLQDKNGVIDLDIPLSGSLEDPQFSLGALIWKVIVNLFNKAVSSPFSVIGGGGKDLSHVQFRPGTAQIADASQDVIAKVAKALDDRPALKLGIVASADPVSERQAMQQAAFDAQLQAEQRRERARGALGSGAAEAPLPPLSAEQRAQLVKQIYADTKLPDKPRNLIGLAKDIPVAEMEAMLVAAIPVDEAAAKELAARRGRAVRDALVAKGLGSERLFLGDAKLRTPEDDKAAPAPWVPQAQLTLSAS